MSYSYAQVADQFMNKVVTPTVAVASSALNGAFAKPINTNASQTESNSARVFNFDPNNQINQTNQTQLKAAS